MTFCENTYVWKTWLVVFELCGQQVDLGNPFCLGGCLVWQELYYWTQHTKSHACRYCWPLIFYTTFNVLGFPRGSHVQLRAKPVGFISRVPNQNGVSQAWYIVKIHHSGQEPSIFSHTSGLISLKFEVALKWFKANILLLLWTVIYGIKKYNCCFFLIALKSINVGSYLEVYEPISNIAEW